VLIINKVPIMPKLAIDSILSCTTNLIYIGYLHPSDIEDIPNNPRIIRVRLTGTELSTVSPTEGEKYVDFSAPEFYKLVQYKWVLLQAISALGFDSIVFTDFDVYWNKNPISALEQVFTTFPDVDIQIQTYTSNPAKEQLCMGFVAFRNTDRLKLDIQQLKNLHAKQLLGNPTTGDDDVISSLFHSDANFRTRVFKLPQSTFPTGNLINAFSRKNLFPGLIPFEPYIFHANFVVGRKKKVLLLETFIAGSQFRKIGTNLARRLNIKFRLSIRRIGVRFNRLVK